MDTEKRGGKRANAGRKKMDDHLIPIYISIRETDVEVLGGKWKTRVLAEKLVLKVSNKKKDARIKAAEQIRKNKADLEVTGEL